MRIEAPLKLFAAPWGQTGPHLTLPVSPDPRAEEEQGSGRDGALVKEGFGLPREQGGRFMLNSPVPGLQLHNKCGLPLSTLPPSLNWKGTELQGRGRCPGPAPHLLGGEPEAQSFWYPLQHYPGLMALSPLYNTHMSVSPADLADDTPSLLPV